MNELSAIFGGPAPWLVGTLSSLPPSCPLAGDIVEVRLDQKNRPADWLAQCAAIQSAGHPVLLTVRLRAEGGGWETDDDQRLELYKAGLRELAAADVELNSRISGEVAREAARLNKASVISFHDFKKTPPLAELRAIIERQHAIGSIAKVSTVIAQPGDADTLRSLLNSGWKKPVCVIGMGAAYSETRIEFPRLGSCLTYGYLDKPAAPGQISAAELGRRLRPSKP
ncbi:MAG TPA: type I 3-dehydroquinate dehydratase [Verrucomicrobiae bacterium]